MSFGGGGSDPIDNYKPGKGKSRVVKTPAFNMKYAVSSGAEPAWPTTVGATITDANGITWQAIRARRIKSTVTGVFGRANFSAESLSVYPDDYFQYGIVTWLTGENATSRLKLMPSASCRPRTSNCSRRCRLSSRKATRSRSCRAARRRGPPVARRSITTTIIAASRTCRPKTRRSQRRTSVSRARRRSKTVEAADAEAL